MNLRRISPRSRAPHSSRSLSRRHLLGAASSGTMGLMLTGCGGTQLVIPWQLRQPRREQATAVPDEQATATTSEQAPDFAPLFAEFTPADEPNGDLAKVVWPDWMAQLDPEIKELYTFQILNGPIMRYMPCFCGCNAEDGHQNNRDCYIDTVNADGSVVFDSMAPT